MSGIAGQSAGVAPLESQSQLISLFMFPKTDKLVKLPSFCTELFLFEIARSSQGLLERGWPLGVLAFDFGYTLPKDPPLLLSSASAAGRRRGS